MPLGEKIAALLALMRPFEWSKTFGNMALAFFAALYLQVGNIALIGFTAANLWTFVIAFIAAGPLLWGGLYTLNDWTDAKKDAKHPLKKLRPIPSGKVSANQALAAALILIALSLGLAWQISFLLFACVAAMLVNELLYTLKPFRFKELPVLDLISGSLVNPVFRFYAGWVLVTGTFNAPILFLLFVLGLQFGGYTLYRLSGKSVEKKLATKSSVVVFGVKPIRYLSYLAMLIGALSYIALTLMTRFLPGFVFLGYLPLRFLFLGLAMLLPAPLYLNALKNPEKMDIKKMYRLIYVHYLVFVFGFIALFFI